MTMLYYDLLCYVMLCYVMLCYVMLCYVMLCYDTMLCNTTLQSVATSYTVLCKMSYKPICVLRYAIIFLHLKCWNPQHLYEQNANDVFMFVQVTRFEDFSPSLAFLI